MLTGLQKAKALKELKQLRLDKASQSGLALAKSLKRMQALRVDLGMGKANEQQVDVEPVIELTGKEFSNYELDFTKEENKEILRDEVRVYLENIADKDGKIIPNNFLKQDVLFNDRGIKETMAWTHQVIKLQILHKIEKIIEIAHGEGEYKVKNTKKDKKSHAEFYYHLSAKINLAGLPLIVKLILEEDKDKIIHYDLKVPRTALGKDKAMFNSLSHDTHSWNESDTAYENNSTKFLNQNQAMFDKATTNTSDMVLNLFIFDENGNEIADDLLGEQPQSTPLQKILTNLQTGTLTPADLDLAEIDRLIADKTPENEAILGQIMDIVADSYKEKVNG